ncbi:MAG: Stp1/IreP family PP2C-type Ser/Thr phosphatase [Longicatena sp.]
MIRLKYFGKSHTGLKRKQNQDSICLVESKDALLAIVCDGIGGGNAGDVASKMAAAHMKDSFLHMKMLKDDIQVKHWLQKTIQEANDLIFTQATKNHAQKGMGTTLVGIFKLRDTTYVFNVGDSRTYGLYQNDFIALTEDHSYIADLLKRGVVSEEEALHHPNRNVLTNALGIWNNVKIDINKISEEYLALLICSDGLHGYVSESAIKHVLAGNLNVEDKVNTLINEALDAGGYDNVSIIIVEREGSLSWTE